MYLDEKGIVVEVLAERKAEEYGVRKGWKIKEINLEDFTYAKTKFVGCHLFRIFSPHNIIRRPFGP